MMEFTNGQPKNRLSLKLGNKKLVQQKLLNSTKTPVKLERKGTASLFSGLSNLGNSCYVNSVLQALRFCPGFCRGVATLHSLTNDSEPSCRPLLISHLHQLLQSMSEEEKSNHAVEPVDFIAALKEEHPVFAGYLQHDAQEMLKFLLTYIQELSVSTICAAKFPPESPVVGTICGATSLPESPVGNTIEICDIKSPRGSQVGEHISTLRFAGKKRKRAPPGSDGGSVKRAPPESDGGSVKRAPPESDGGSVKKSLIEQEQNTCKKLTDYYSPIRHQVSSPSSSRHRAKHKHSDFITDIFQGQLTYQTHCYECDSYTKRSETFLDITVPVSSTCLPGFPQCFSPVKQTKTRVGPYSLAWALSQFASQERLRGENKYWCDHCGHLAEAERSILFLQLPHVVTVHLNRFSTQQWGIMSSVTVGKVGGNIAIPVVLSLKPWCTPECANKDKKYELFAVVFHSGSSCSSGHYTTCVRSRECQLLQTGVKGQDRTDWIYFDDDVVDTIPQSEMFAMLSPVAPGSTTAYILFYTTH